MVRSRGGAVAAVVESTVVRRNLPLTLAPAVPLPPAPLAPTPDRCRRPYNSCGGNNHDTRFGGGRRSRRPPPPLPYIGGIRRSGRRLDTDDDKRYRYERFE